MPSFDKQEPPFRWPSVSSVLDDPDSGVVAWPFNFDWNGLFCFDLKLLDIADPVLSDVAKLLDNESRRELSFTCRKFRNIISRNKTPAMDIRKVRDLVITSSGANTSFEFKDKESRHYSDPISLSNTADVTAFLGRVGKSTFLDMVVWLLEDSSVDLPMIVSAMEKMTDKVTIVWNNFRAHPSDEFVIKATDAFMTYPYVRCVRFGAFLPSGFDACSERVKQWSIRNGYPQTVKLIGESFYLKNGYGDATSIVVFKNQV